MSVPPDIYAFSATVEDCRAYVRLNGLPLVEVEPRADRKKMGEVVSMWIRPGANVLEVSLALRPEVNPRACRFEGKLVRVPRFEPRPPPVALVEVDWPPPTSGDLVPYYHQHQFTGATPSRLWDLAEPQGTGPRVEEELLSFAASVHEVFGRKDPLALGQLLDFKGRDIGRVLDLGEEGGRRSQRSFLDTILSAPDLEVEPLDPAALRIWAISERRIFRIRRGDRPLLLTDAHQGMDVYAAKIDGRWVVVR